MAVEYREQIAEFAGMCPHCGKQFTDFQRYEMKGDYRFVRYHKFDGQKCPGVGNEYEPNFYASLWKDMDTEIVSSVGLDENAKCTICQRKRPKVVSFGDGKQYYEGGECGSVCEKCLEHLKEVLTGGSPQ